MQPFEGNHGTDVGPGENKFDTPALEKLLQSFLIVFSDEDRTSSNLHSFADDFCIFFPFSSFLRYLLLLQILKVKNLKKYDINGRNF